VSLDATDGQSQKWFDEDRLAAYYENVPKDKTVYVYCHDGFRMSLGWLQMKSLGYRAWATRMCVC
jgi:thiosulfate/3-mercaptopyruvate sulfurtransferase